MTKDDKIFVLLAAILLLGMLFFNMPKRSKSLSVSQSKALNPSPAYVRFNQPFLFAPPVANILPQTASGILGQKFEPETVYDGTDLCGCGT